MSYPLEYIETLLPETVLQLIHTVDPNYVSKGDRLDRYSLVYLAYRYNQLAPEDLPLVENPRFIQLYLLPNSELINETRSILGIHFKSRSRIDLINQILNLTHTYVEPTEVYELFGRYLLPNELRNVAANITQPNLNQLLLDMAKPFGRLVQEGNAREIIRRIKFTNAPMTNRELGNMVEILINRGNSGDLMINAARTGYLPLVKYLIEQDYSYSPNNLLENAIFSGNIDLVKYLIEERGIIPIYPRVLEIAARTGNLELFKYLIGPNTYVLIYYSIIEQAALSGNLELVRYLIESGADPHNPIVIQNAARSGSLPLVQYLISLNIDSTDPGIIANAALSGNLELVKYLIDSAPHDSKLIADAASSGNLDLVRYLIEEQNLIPDSTTLENAVQGKSLPLVEYLLNLGVSITEQAIQNAIKYDDLVILKFLADQHLLGDPTVLLRIAAERGNLPMAKYLVNQGANPQDYLSFKAAERSRNPDVIAYLKQFR